jgi:hypothetical protein
MRRELIAAAKQRSDPSIEYHLGDARELQKFLPEAHFDAAACVLAIQNIHPINGVFSGVAGIEAGRAFCDCDDAPGLPRCQGDQLGVGSEK